MKVRLILDTLKGAVLVPAEAPQISAMGPFVYVVSDDLKAELRTVKLGQQQENRVVVEEGLRPGERVVTVGHVGVIPKGKVRIDEPSRPASTSSREPGK